MLYNKIKKALVQRGKAMYLHYKNTNRKIQTVQKRARHAGPHLHSTLEMIYVTEGTLELGIGQELYHLETGDLGIVFPDVIHHYQVFSPGENKAVYLWAKPVLTGQFADIIQNSCPEDPVIKKEQVHPDIVNAVRCLRANRKEKDDNLAVEQAYVQISGFESQRTFNRVFRERYRMTPREYRTLYKEKYLREEQT